ncbi:MAG: sulfatase, partial [Candidatus Hydrogenedentes bacterium]|nr:sulfatase [Candidatus Hydrogenedentota bacterium]
VSAGLLFLYLLLDRFASAVANYALSFAGTFGLGGLVIGVFRYKRDILEGHAAHLADYLKIAGGVAAIAVTGLVVLYVLGRSAEVMTRRRPAPLMASAAGLFLALVAAGLVTGMITRPQHAAAAFKAATQSPGPNIILVSVDTLRADYLKLYDPDAKAATPALDALAKDAALFHKAFSQASWTKPSFATIFTGLYPEQHTATTKTAAIPDEVETLAELLFKGGYYTKGFPNNPNVSPLFNFGQGFVEYTYLEPSLYFGAESSSSKLALYNVLRLGRQVGSQKLAKIVPSLGKMNVYDFYQPAEVVTGLALEWLDTKTPPADTPFYLYLHYMDPHDPFMDPESPEGGYARVRMEHPDPDKFTEPMKKAYVREIEYLDQWLARLFEGLKQRGLYDNSLIVFTADHGEEFFEHHGWWHGQTLYDEVTKVPLLLKLPANKEAGVVNEDLARHIDLAPTLLKFAGIDKPAVLPGIVLYDPASGFGNAGTAFSYAENDFEGNVLQSVRSKSMKIINANADNPRQLAPVELYDVAQDPREQQNLAGKPEAVPAQEGLQQVVADYQKVIEENAAEPSGGVDTGNVDEQLKSLGYL